MADDEKEKKTASDRISAGASFIGNIVKAVKYLANPVIFWIAIGLLILVFIISLWGFIESMPGNALAQIRAFFTGKEKVERYNVTEKELQEICKYIEEMGYDLEGYGFVETIQREETDDGKKGNIIINNTGEENVKEPALKSKYLEAYIVANKEIYNFANNDYEKGLIVKDESLGVTGRGWLELLFSRDVTADAKIEDKDELFVIEITEKNGLLGTAAFGRTTQYGYDLNEWTCKYGRPTEFLIALHIATGAPDFVYKLATEPEVDTKVHLELYPTTANIELLDKENGNDYREFLTNIQNDVIKVVTGNETIKSFYDECIANGGAYGEKPKPPTYIIEENPLLVFYDYMEYYAGFLIQWPRNYNEAFTFIKDTKVKINLGDGDKEYSVEKLVEIIKEISKFIKDYCVNRTIITPYITRVVQHWYRNQYFVLKTAEEAKNTLIEKNEPTDNNSIINERLNGGAYKYNIDEVTNQYQLTLSGGQTFGVENDDAKRVLETLWIKETRKGDIIQVANPLFEDNSHFIRSWLKDKYYIYRGGNNGESQANEEQNKSGTSKNEPVKILNDSKKIQGKEYIDGKNALEKVRSMLENCDDRENIKYMERDLIELLEDFEFDFENVETLEDKVLENVMPEYVPYTPWPSVFEEGDGNYTKMIYKTPKATKIVAPADGIITKTDSETIEIEFTISDEEKDSNGKNNETSKISIVNGFTLRIKAEKCGFINVRPGGAKMKVKAGEEIGYANPTDGLVTLKLYLFNQEKAIEPVKKYMSVPSKELKDLTKEEISRLKEIMHKQIGEEYSQGDGTFGDYYNYVEEVQTGIANVIFNRILSPNKNYKNCIDIESSIKSLEDEDEKKRSGQTSRINNFNSQLEKIINKVINGVDTTKNRIAIGATCYDAVYLRNVNDHKTFDELDKKMEEIKLKKKLRAGSYSVDLGSEYYFYVKDEEMDGYLEPLINKKVDEVIYTLNKEKYIEGIEEYNKFAANFDEIKKEILKFYTEEAEKQQDDGTVIKRHRYDIDNRYEDKNGMVTSIIKSKVSQETEDTNDQSKKITDKFTFTADGNYVTNFTMTYTIDEFGKINGNVKLEKIENVPTKMLDGQTTNTDQTGNGE